MKRCAIHGLTSLLCLAAAGVPAQERPFDGLAVDMSSLYRLSKAKTRSISPENFTGEKGKGGMAAEGTGKESARDLGQKWKVSPSVKIDAGQTFTLAEIAGPGAIQQIWMTPTGNWRCWTRSATIPSRPGHCSLTGRPRSSVRAGRWCSGLPFAGKHRSGPQVRPRRRSPSCSFRGGHRVRLGPWNPTSGGPRRTGPESARSLPSRRSGTTRCWSAARLCAGGRPSWCG